jgi:oxalate decarboxylase/phosphoglucose isomerase-like protein (cupin superfamily)
VTAFPEIVVGTAGDGEVLDLPFVSGEVTFDTADGVLTVGAGGSVSVPRGQAHGYRNATSEAARLTTVFTPAGYENYFRAVASAALEGVEITRSLLNELRAGQRTTPASF